MAHVQYLPRAENIAVAGTDLWVLYPGGWGYPDLQLDSGTMLICLTGWSNFSRGFTARRNRTASGAV
jgi:hypothetical protein